MSMMEEFDEIKWLMSLVAYDDSIGSLTWKDGPKNGEKACHNNGCGYLMVSVCGCRYTEHRVVWAICHGEWPKGVIDHINGDRIDNRIINLRDVPKGVNNENQTRAKSNNKLGILGVEQRGKSFRASIQSKGKAHKLGTFDTADAAHTAYIEAKRILHEGCTI